MTKKKNIPHKLVKPTDPTWYKTRNFEIHIDGKSVAVCHERKATKAERAADPDAKVMAEWVHIEFGTGEPKITINRDLCGD